MERFREAGRKSIAKEKERKGKKKEEQQGEEVARLWNANITSMEQNGGFMIGKEADVISFEEHKMKKSAMGWIRDEFMRAGWKMMCGPADESGKKQQQE